MIIRYFGSVLMLVFSLSAWGADTIFYAPHFYQCTSINKYSGVCEQFESTEFPERIYPSLPWDKMNRPVNFSFTVASAGDQVPYPSSIGAEVRYSDPDFGGFSVKSLGTPSAAVSTYWKHDEDGFYRCFPFDDHIPATCPFTYVSS